MDENLMPISRLWDPEVQEDVRSKIPSHKWNPSHKVNTQGYLQDVEGVYHAIGGFARLAHTANEDPKWFYNRFGDRLLPNVKEELDVNITILPALARSPLDGEYTEVPVDGQHNGILPGMRGGDDSRDGNVGDMHSVRSRDDARLDQGGYQAPRSLAPGTPRPPGSEDPFSQDGPGQEFR